MKVSEDRYWTAFYTKPRNEKRAFERLSSKGYEVFCPMKTVLKQWSDRKKKVKEVLFPSYVFCKVTEGERIEILKDSSISCSVFWLGKPVKILEREILAIKDFISAYPSADFELIDIIEGQTVRVSDGPFKGESGEVIKSLSKKVVLVIQSLGISIQAEISKQSLELVK